MMKGSNKDCIMKKLILLLLAPLLFTGCTTSDHTIKNSKKTLNNSRIIDSASNETDWADWAMFSKGLHYKNLGINSTDPDERDKHFSLSIDFFNRSAKSGISLDRIYFQLSDCYYYKNDFEKSVSFAEKSISSNPGNFNPYNKIYNIQMKLRNYRDAAKILSDYLKIVPDSINVQYALAEHYYKNLSDLKNAEKYFINVLTLAKKSPVDSSYKEYAGYYLGYISYKNKKFNQAIKFYKMVFNINKSNMNSVYMLALLYMENYRITEAEFFAKKFLAVDPDNAAMHSVLGRILYLQNKNGLLHHLKAASVSKTVESLVASGLHNELLEKDKEARLYLASALKYRPKYVSPHLAMARIYMRAGEKKAALDELIKAGALAYRYKLHRTTLYCFNIAGRIKRDMPQIYFYLAKTYEEMDKLSLAVVNYKRLNSLKNDTEIILHIGYLYALKGEYSMAFSYLDSASKKEPENSKPHFFRGLVSLWSRNYPKAEVNLKKAISLKNSDDTYYFYLAVVQEKQNKFNETIKSLKLAIKHNPNSARAHNYLGYLYADNNINIEESLSHIKKAIKIEPNNAAFLDSLGWVLYRKKNYSTALKKLLLAEKNLEEKKSPDPVVYDHIGDTYDKIGKKDKAIQYWGKSFKLLKNKKIMKKINNAKKSIKKD